MNKTPPVMSGDRLRRQKGNVDTSDPGADGPRQQQNSPGAAPVSREQETETTVYTHSDNRRIKKTLSDESGITGLPTSSSPLSPVEHLWDVLEVNITDMQHLLQLCNADTFEERVCLVESTSQSILPLAVPKADWAPWTWC